MRTNSASDRLIMALLIISCHPPPRKSYVWELFGSEVNGQWCVWLPGKGKSLSQFFTKGKLRRLTETQYKHFLIALPKFLTILKHFAHLFSLHLLSSLYSNISICWALSADMFSTEQIIFFFSSLSSTQMFCRSAHLPFFCD